MRVIAYFFTLVVLFLSFLSPYRIEGKLQTVFVDDTQGDSLTGASPAFLPSEAGFSQGPLCHGCGDAWCQGCALEPDSTKAHGGTWMVATHFMNDPAKFISFDFVGTEVTVFCIVPNLPSSSNIVTRYSLDFRIDLDLPPNGQTTYDHLSDSSGAYQYNVSVFHQTGLPNTKHSMMIRAMRSDIDTVMLFDYATYVHDDGQPETSKSPSTTKAAEPSDPPSTSATIIPKDSQSHSSVTSVPPPNNTSTSTLLTSSSAPSNNSSSIPTHSSGPTHNQSTGTSSSISAIINTIPTTASSASPRSTPSVDVTQLGSSSSSSSSNRPRQLAAILGSTFGTLLILALGAFLVRRLWVRRRISQASASEEVTPFSQQNPSIPKNREKSSFVQNASTSSNSLPNSTTLPTSDYDTEPCADEPPTYSQRGFQLN